MEQNGALAHPRKGGNRHMGLVVVAQFTVNLIADHYQVVLDAEPGDPVQILPTCNPTGGICREVKDQNT